MIGVKMRKVILKIEKEIELYSNEEDENKVLDDCLNQLNENSDLEENSVKDERIFVESNEEV